MLPSTLYKSLCLHITTSFGAFGGKMGLSLGWYRKKEDWLLKKDCNQRRSGGRRKKMVLCPRGNYFAACVMERTVWLCEWCSFIVCVCVYVWNEEANQNRIGYNVCLYCHFLVSSYIGPRLWRRERASSSTSSYRRLFEEDFLIQT